LTRIGHPALRRTALAGRWAHPIEEINEHFGLTRRTPYDTIAGFMLGRLGRLATVGDTVTTDGVRLTVDSMDGKRVARVWIFPRASPS
jgi:CBS domain containing-hemolysin-like protein